MCIDHAVCKGLHAWSCCVQPPAAHNPCHHACILGKRASAGMPKQALSAPLQRGWNQQQTPALLWPSPPNLHMHLYGKLPQANSYCDPVGDHTTVGCYAPSQTTLHLRAGPSNACPAGLVFHPTRIRHCCMLPELPTSRLPCMPGHLHPLACFPALASLLCGPPCAHAAQLQGLANLSPFSCLMDRRSVCLNPDSQEHHKARCTRACRRWRRHCSIRCKRRR